MPDGPRCLHPMRKYEQKRPRDELDTTARDDPDPVCWRPLHHPGSRHISKASYWRMQARERQRRTGMSDPGGRLAS